VRDEDELRSDESNTRGVLAALTGIALVGLTSAGLPVLKAVGVVALVVLVVLLVRAAGADRLTARGADVMGRVFPLLYFGDRPS